ncbi:50S ribosomal protein L6 [bacterium]|nr:50S ribosomal protein L6 [bacterium]
MSRVGKQPVQLPSGVKAQAKGSSIEIEGPKGKVSVPLLRSVTASIESAEITVKNVDISRQAKANWGTQRALLSNAVVGVTDGWSKKLELQGVGFNAVLKGNVITLATGYSHKNNVELPAGVTAQVSKQEIVLESCDRELVGQVAASLRAACPPEPYLGKGIRYAGENVRRKAGKTGAK